MEPGSVINDKYQVVALLGSGGMGHVYRVRQVSLGKEFALKVLDARSLSDITVRRFHQEARTTSQLQHPNLVEVHDFGVLNETQPYLVMDLIEGESLSETLKREGSLPVDYVIPLAIQVCFGLMYAHKKGVVHRDVKPGNIMLLQPAKLPAEGTVKVVDFGIAKLTQSEDGEIQALTKTGEIFGSPIYMSPEQCKGTGVDKRSDIYSFGCVLFECLTGSPPFFGDSAMSTMMKRLSEAPVSLKEGSLGREFPAALENIIRKMLAVEPNDRYQDFSAVVQDLITLQTTGGAAPVGTPAKAENVRAASLNPHMRNVAFVVSASMFITFAVDFFLLFPEQVQAEIAARKAAAAKAALERKLEEEKALSLQAKDRALENEARSIDLKSSKTFGSPSNAWSAHEQEVVDKNIPFIDTSGRKRFLVFPKLIGRFYFIGDKKEQRAIGRFEVKPDARLVLALDHAAGSNPDILKNITSLKFNCIDYNTNFFVENRTIEALKNIKFLEIVRLKASNVSSLAPLYDNSTLKIVEVIDTKVSESELLKLKTFGQLQRLTFGPVAHPEIVLEALARTNKVDGVSYKGEDTTHKKRDPEGLRRELSALIKLVNLKALSFNSCDYVDDNFVQKLTGLQSLDFLEVRDCAVTAKSIETFKKFKKLKMLKITTTNWSLADIAELYKFKARGVQVENLLGRDARINVNAEIEAGRAAVEQSGQ